MYVLLIRLRRVMLNWVSFHKALLKYLTFPYQKIPALLAGIFVGNDFLF
jgi:hypothetical protein